MTSTTKHPLPSHFILPDLLDQWPFETEPNPHQEIVDDSARWVESYKAFSPKAQDAFNRCNFGIFASLAYPRSEGTHYRAACDLMNLFFVFDEFSDAENGDVVRQQAADIMNALRYPDKIPAGGDSILGAMTRDYWKRTLEVSSKSSAERFIRNFDGYTDAVRQEAVDRDEGRERTIEEYMELRRGTIGVYPSFDYFLLEDDIPDEYIDHPAVASLALGAVDMTILANDVYSWNVEQCRGEDRHNLVAVAMREKGLSVQEAMDYVGTIYAGIRDKYVKEFNELPQFPEKHDKLVKDYCWHMGNWVTTNIKWSHFGERYFGKKGREILKHRTVEVMRPSVLGWVIKKAYPIIVTVKYAPREYFYIAAAFLMLLLALLSSPSRARILASTSAPFSPSF
ncbi:terpene cyclase [Pleurotus pulmonarius]|nr:terpene cyclase [Pleurotus pulmonarius]KAF4588961.1 terpene cyclase [Pleurotus pulmonarius]